MINKDNILLYHGSNVIVEKPRLIKTKHIKDFGVGFYVTNLKEQAERWALRKGINKGVVSVYKMNVNDELNTLIFKNLDKDWVNFIALCRSGRPHSYDLIEGSVADDTIYNYVNDFMRGELNYQQFLVLCMYNRPSHQICFHTNTALESLKFIKSYTITRR